VAAFRAAQAEAASAFGVPDVYLEKYVDAPRHIEIQVMADSRGNVVHLGERECSIQRRHQKIIEEAPSTFVSEKLRSRMGKTAVDAAKAVQYVNAGTVEFLVDSHQNYYFMEMNTRIQVEHPVTEMVTGRDLIKEMIAVAAGQPLSFSQRDVRFSGHAIECRINAEDAVRDFMPCPGKVGFVHLPGGMGVRVDSHVYQGYTITPYYDSMIAKVICHGLDRDEAVRRMLRALDEYVIEGVTTLLPFHRALLEHPCFVAGETCFGLVETIAQGARADGRRAASVPPVALPRPAPPRRSSRRYRAPC